MLRLLTPAEAAQWEELKYKEDKEKVLDFCARLSKDTGRIILTGIEDANMLVEGDRWHWVMHWLCSKPDTRYLATMGTLYKVYPDGKVVSSSWGVDWVGRNVKCATLIRKGGLPCPQ